MKSGRVEHKNKVVKIGVIGDKKVSHELHEFTRMAKSISENWWQKGKPRITRIITNGEIN